MTNHIETHEELIQVIRQDGKLKLVKTDMKDTVDTIDLMEL